MCEIRSCLFIIHTRRVQEIETLSARDHFLWMLSCSARYFPAAPCSHRIPRRTRRVAPVRSTPKDNMSIQEYIEEHGLGKKVEDVINAAVKAKAAEPISFMVRRGESNHRFGSGD